MLNRFISLVPLGSDKTHNGVPQLPNGLEGLPRFYDIYVDKQSTPEEDDFEEESKMEQRPGELKRAAARRLAPTKPHKNPSAVFRPVAETFPDKFLLLSVPVFAQLDVLKSWLKLDEINKIIVSKKLSLAEVMEIIPCTYAYATEAKKSNALHDTLFYLGPYGPKKVHDKAHKDVCDAYSTLTKESKNKFLATVIDRMWRHFDANMKGYVKERRVGLFRSILAEAIVGNDLPLPLFVPGVIEKLGKMGLTDLPLTDTTVQNMFENMISVEVRLEAIQVMMKSLSNSKVLSDVNFELLRGRLRTELEDRNYKDMYEEVSLYYYSFFSKLRLDGLESRIPAIQDAITEVEKYTFEKLNEDAPCAAVYMADHLKQEWATMQRQWGGSKSFSPIQLEICRFWIDNKEEMSKDEIVDKVHEMIRAFDRSVEDSYINFRGYVDAETSKRINDWIGSRLGRASLPASNKPGLFSFILGELMKNGYPILTIQMASPRLRKDKVATDSSSEDVSESPQDDAESDSEEEMAVTQYVRGPLVKQNGFVV